MCDSSCTDTSSQVPVLATVMRKTAGLLELYDQSHLVSMCCRDTYPNQHVRINVQALLYRWFDRDENGLPQVPSACALLQHLLVLLLRLMLTIATTNKFCPCLHSLQQL